MKVELVDKTCVINIAYTKYDSDLQLFELDYSRLYYEWYKDAMQIPPTNDTKLIPHHITIKNPISGYECMFRLKYHNDDVDNPVEPNEIARYYASFIDSNGTSYYELSITVPVKKAEDEWVDVTDKVHDSLQQYITQYIPAEDVGYEDYSSKMAESLAEYIKQIYQTGK